MFVRRTTLTWKTCLLSIFYLISFLGFRRCNWWFEYILPSLRCKFTLVNLVSRSFCCRRWSFVPNLQRGMKSETRPAHTHTCNYPLLQYPSLCLSVLMWWFSSSTKSLSRFRFDPVSNPESVHRTELGWFVSIVTRVWRLSELSSSNITTTKGFWSLFSPFQNVSFLQQFLVYLIYLLRWNKLTDTCFLKFNLLFYRVPPFSWCKRVSPCFVLVPSVKRMSRISCLSRRSYC